MGADEGVANHSVFNQHRKPFLRIFLAGGGEEPTVCVVCPHRLVVHSGLDDLRLAQIGARKELTQKFAVQVKLLFEFFGQCRTLLVGSHDIGDDHDQKLGAILLQGIAAEQSAEPRNLAQNGYAGLPRAAVVGDEAAHDKGAAVLQRQGGADPAAEDGRGARDAGAGGGLRFGEFLGDLQVHEPIGLHDGLISSETPVFR